MHARVEQLLSLRDGEPVDAAVQVHVAGCAHCSDSLAGLARMREQLQAMPEPVSSSDDWQAVQHSVAQRGTAGRRREWVTRAALAASIAALAIATVWRLNDPAPELAAHGVNRADADLALTADRLSQLRTQSQALEELLAELPMQTAVERAGTALPIDTIEAQVQWLDYQILVSGDEMQSAATEQLWRERVEAMNSLVRLRYVDAQRVAM
jgi:hypothetical protein